jgi:hypothetical protein
MINQSPGSLCKRSAMVGDVIEIEYALRAVSKREPIKGSVIIQYKFIVQFQFFYSFSWISVCGNQSVL